MALTPTVGRLETIQAEDTSLHLPLSTSGVPGPRVLFPYLVKAFLHRRGVGVELVMYPALLHRLLHVVAEPQAVDDRLQGPEGQRGPWGQDEGGCSRCMYLCSGCGDVCAPRSAHYHVDAAFRSHDDGGAHGRKWLLPCGESRQSQELVSCLPRTLPSFLPTLPAPHLAG